MLGDWPRLVCQFSSIVNSTSHQEAKDVDVKEYFGKIVVVGTCEYQECLDHPFLSGQYGEIEHINLKHDPMTGRSRGFAFIVFKVPTY